MKVFPLIDCRGEILEIGPTPDSGNHYCYDCKPHGTPCIADAVSLWLDNGATQTTAVVTVFVAKNYLPGVERKRVLDEIMRNADKKAWLFTYAERLPHG
jgi:hypothetical protein